MPELNVGDLVVDPIFAQPYTVYRQSGSFVLGRWVGSEATIAMYGTIVINNPKDILQVPEADRISGIITILATTPMYVTRDTPTAGTSDEIVFKSERYRVFNSYDWSDFGYYKVIAVRMRGV